MEKNLTLVPVVAAALIAPDGSVLMQRRQSGAQHGGLWEFPGGKVEAGELADAALIRELEEELGIAVAVADLVPLSFAARPGERVVLLLYTCRDWQGTPRCLDAAELQWFVPGELAALAMPPLDIPLAAALTKHLAEAK